MQRYRGIPASPGIAMGPAFFFQEADLSFTRHTITAIEPELARFESARAAAGAQISVIKAKALTEVSADEAAIFDAHALFLDDPTLIDAIRASISDQHCNAEAAVSDAVEEQAAKLSAMEDEYFRARAADVRDVGQRLLRNLLGVSESDLSTLQAASIILARDLTPSDTVRLDKSLVLGFLTALGGPTSHTAILAKALDLPAVVGVGETVMAIENGTTLTIDGSTGEVASDPDKAVLAEFAQRKHSYTAESRAALSRAHEPATTRDGTTVEIVANVGNPADTQQALEHGAEGIGLLRTEFLYMERPTAPDEDEQVAAYNAIFDLMGDRPVVVRTLDVGGDKAIPYLDLGVEANPFLGWRAIRMTLDEPEFFKIQLRALVRASPDHDVRIMFPMVATLPELRAARTLLDEARQEVIEAGHPVADKIQVGIMVEIPSVAVLADRFAREVDFFSIGTNDLTQYTMAAERTNEKVAHLGDACHPAVLRQIQRVIKAAHEQGIWVGLCGELAGDADAIPILLGLGLDEFSMAPAAIPRAKEIIRRWKISEAQKLLGAVLDMDTAEQVRSYIRQAQ
jgi:phosphoenolpyruvate-protein phosphotransferase